MKLISSISFYLICLPCSVSSTEKWSDRWIQKGIPKYLMSLWIKKTFGVNEYRDLVHQHMYDVVEYEGKYGGIILDSSQAPANIVSIKGEASRYANSYTYWLPILYILVTDTDTDTGINESTNFRQNLLQTSTLWVSHCVQLTCIEIQ